jgi:hypothetical protein
MRRPVVTNHIRSNVLIEHNLPQGMIYNWSGRQSFGTGPVVVLFCGTKATTLARQQGFAMIV